MLRSGSARQINSEISSGHGHCNWSRKLKTERHVAFLRGINLGKRRPPMSQLRELFSRLGFEQVETFIASGNVLFSSPRQERGQLEKKIARHLEESLGYLVETFIRTAEEVRDIARRQPFPEDGTEGVTIHVAFLHQPLAPAVGRQLAAIRTASDEFSIGPREYYWLCRIRMNESKVWTLPALKALRLPSSSMRNMTSIRKLAGKHLT